MPSFVLRERTPQLVFEATDKTVQLLQIPVVDHILHSPRLNVFTRNDTTLKRASKATAVENGSQISHFLSGSL